MDCLTPQLACVVLSLGNPPTLAAAVRSLLSQSEPAEVVVVNSGGGNPAETLRRAGMDVKVITRETRLFPGAVRNIGIEATQAPFVAFLADDCVAEPGWVEGRMKRHRAGALAVSSAVTNRHPRNLSSRASHVYLYWRRMPDTPDHKVIHFGVSYARTLFDRFGLFREDLRSGEDSEFNDRIKGDIPIAWAPEVRSAHLHPTTPLALVRDQFARGARRALTRRLLTGRHQEWLIVRNALVRTRKRMRLAASAGEAGDRPLLLGIAVVFAAVVYALGALLSVARRPQDGVSRRGPRILALLQFHNEMQYLPGYFRNVAPQVDGIIALDDGSTDGSGEFVARQPAVLCLIRIPPSGPHVWDEPRNRRLLVEGAREHDPDWLIAIDADERLERRFRERAIAEIARAEQAGYLAFAVRFRELWGSPDTYRVDGIWGRKAQARFFRARLDHEFDTRPLHSHWAPLNSKQAERYPTADLVIYHLRMIEQGDRLARRDRYMQRDPHNQWQRVGYEYLTEEEGLRLERLPAGREYDPPAGGPA
ncbi:MAG: glycosyltransferase [bacterium]|nr:glycosyltransferase [bacterium]